jgi:hypothetical protein
MEVLPAHDSRAVHFLRRIPRPSDGDMVILEGPKLFMPLEAAYVLAAAATVYRASREDADNIISSYRRAVKKVLPPILVLMVVSALVEAYEIV